jgi:16S rRNA G1207 methylase RsmC
VNELPDGDVACTSVGRAQLAVAAARASGARRVDCTLFDLHLLERAQAAMGAAPGNLNVAARADLPEGPFAAVAIPLRSGGDAEFAWELLQQAYLRLADGGLFFTAVDGRRDHWVAGRMEALFGRKFARLASDDAIAYRATKRGELKRVKSFEAELAFRDRGRLIRAVSRPGVFSHRKVDVGARALVDSLAETNGTAERDLLLPGARVLDLGCGCGVVGFAAALRAPGVRVHAVDSMPRAVECARRGAGLNGLEGWSAEVAADGGALEPKSFDLVLANPPYYSHHRIADLFVEIALRALRSGGRVHFVTRQPEWFEERLPGPFASLRRREIRGYTVVDGVRR